MTRSRHCPRLSSASLALVLPFAATAQTVWNVTAPNGIPAAIAAASPGDVIVLTNGVYYDPFYLNRGLTIRGNGAVIGSGPGSPGGAVTVAIPPGQIAHLDEIQFTYGYSPFGTSGCPVGVSGVVRIDRCAFLTRNYVTAFTASNAQVTMVASTITSGGTTSSGFALEAHNNSRLVLRDCTVTGSDAGCHAVGCFVGTFPAVTAAVLTNSSLHAERTSFSGGHHLNMAFPGDGGSGIDATNCLLWLADCTVTGGSSAAGLGATALQQAGTTAADLRQTQLVAGTPGGLPSTGPVNPAAPLLRLLLQPVWTRGQGSALTLRGDPNAPFGLFLTPATSHVTIPGAVVEPVLAGGAVALAAGLLDPAGDAAFTILVPNVASLLHAPVWCQAVSGMAFPLRASTIAGGLIR
ncbi:MAG: hypothetical protein WAT39_13845 [Planctomycetota bacterium]